jgi:carbon-monoxide dehydrogenase large subunit
MAAVAVRKKVLAVAAHLLETSPQDLEIKDGQVAIAGTDHRITLKAVAEAVSGVPGYSMPGNFEPGLESMQNFIPPALTYGIGCHAVEVEVDIDTVAVRILRYAVVNDSGCIINPMIVHGQIVGGVAHAIGNSLYEWMGYDEQAQPVTTNFADYLLVSATEVPNIEVTFAEYPSPLNPLGVKGVGETGCVPAAGAIISAIENALTPFGIEITEYPVTPARLFSLLNGARNYRGKFGELR